MQNVILSLLINGMMAALLLATMIYCRRLNSRIKILQDSKSELARIVREFDESTQRATQSIADIHAATTRLSENIQHKIDKANFLADDLEYMIEKGQKLTGKVDAPVAAAPAPQATISPRPSRASMEPKQTVAPAPQPAPEPTKRPQTLGDVLAPDAISRPPMSETLSSLQGGDAKRGGPRLRSRAEQEIMSALGAKKNPNE